MSAAAERRENIHATAIVVGTAGVLFVGPSGSGKSARAFACLADARAHGLFAALVADDRVLVSAAGGAILAEAPGTTASLIERRGTGILRVPHVHSAVLHLACACPAPAEAERLPELDGTVAVGRAGTLPAVPVAAFDHVLATIAALHPAVLRL